MENLAPSSVGAAAVNGDVVSFFDRAGTLQRNVTVDAAVGLARFGDEWLVLAQEQKHLARIGEDERAQRFAAGKGAIVAFDVGVDDAVAVCRGEAMELWSRDGKKVWSAKGGPFLRALVTRDHVVALAADGALVFFDRAGEANGALRLA